ncbi:MAG: 50S ribosomal protein L17 [Propionibacteriaceae bacterium]|nr:50S ribosomal protein L17 [Propionibacteriaceae bacterium]
MPKPTKGPRIGGSPAHQRIILANLASQLFEHGKITTTETRAKRVQPLAEHLITKAKRGDVAARRVVAKTVRDNVVLKVLFDEVAPAMANREGGYTRITKLGTRQGDGAPMAQIELIMQGGPAASKRPAKAASKQADEAAVADIMAAQQALAEADKAAQEIKADEVAEAAQESSDAAAESEQTESDADEAADK